MTHKFDPAANWEETRAQVGYIDRSESTNKTYTDLGFKCGLEIHQQLNTAKKLFCRCPAGIYQEADDFDAEVIRHMRPTLSEMGEYDGTALMERRTRKNITYRLKSETACTYEIDDTPPFPLNMTALDFSIEIALLLKANIVGELHITRKQYLDGSIPTGFQRTAIVGVGGDIKLRHKTVGMIQLSLEEDSCREVSDIGHERIYRTDRLGMPLIEMVTHPELLNPDEAMEAGNYLRHLSRSSGKARTGIGAGRQDVNVSITGGTRIEIKGVAHIKWIPQLTHIEAYRQKALLVIKDKLAESGLKAESWKVKTKIVEAGETGFDTTDIFGLTKEDDQICIITLPGFHGLLSHFTQPNQSFANELSDRLKVIACLEKPNMIHTEEIDPPVAPAVLRELAKAGKSDAVILIRSDLADINEGIATIEERCLMAFDGIPGETRKSFSDGTTIFERVLPGPDRMYPDTDSAPIRITAERIEAIQANLVTEIAVLRDLLDKWQVAADTHEFLLNKGLVLAIKECSEKYKLSPKWLGNLFGHRIKHYYNRQDAHNQKFEIIFDLFKYLFENKIEIGIAKLIIPMIYKQPGKPISEYFEQLGFTQMEPLEINNETSVLVEKFKLNRRADQTTACWQWVMGSLAPKVSGNINMSAFSKTVKECVNRG